VHHKVPAWLPRGSPKWKRIAEFAQDGWLSMMSLKNFHLACLECSRQKGFEKDWPLGKDKSGTAGKPTITAFQVPGFGSTTYVSRPIISNYLHIPRGDKADHAPNLCGRYCSSQPRGLPLGKHQQGNCRQIVTRSTSQAGRSTASAITELASLIRRYHSSAEATLSGNAVV
jgi:hypothetical protein